MNEFMEQEPARERLVGDHRVHERVCGHVGEVRQRARIESHPLEFRVEVRVGDLLPAEHNDARRVQRGCREERLHRCLLSGVRRYRLASVDLALAINVFGDLLDDPRNFGIKKFRQGHRKSPGTELRQVASR